MSSRKFSGNRPDSGDSSNRPDSDSGGGDDAAVDFLRALKRPEIVEVLSEGFCQDCRTLLDNRIQNLFNGKFDGVSLLSTNNSDSSEDLCSANSSSLYSPEKSSTSSTNGFHQHKSSPWSSTRTSELESPIRPQVPIANSPHSSSVSSRQRSLDRVGFGVSPDNGLVIENGVSDDKSEQGERMRVSQVGRKKDFVYIERIDGKPTNVLQGLELHTRVFDTEDQKKIVDYIYSLQRMGQKGQLRARTYSEPKKWMRGKGRVTMQFGCCYNYAIDKNGNPPGIVRDEEVDPLPLMFKKMIERLVRWHVLPPTCIPNSCIVNIYEEGDCIPPHIDHHDFIRPFCTVSFLTECKILFGSNLKVVSAGEFSGPVSIPLPVGSVLILAGNGADIAKHCVPGVPAKRISITFRRMDDRKLPYTFSPDPELQGLKPLVYAPSSKSPVQQVPVRQQAHHSNQFSRKESESVGQMSISPFHLGNDDFPPLGGVNPKNKLKTNKN
ncbi:hypothetical protein HHK36_008975 [Tetracentron sinense]|uniref:Fe2OG dioxygenase domain-containing protein n=1 Tax=Tetracentron sinense TaxID=13715 RepID=A0A834ZEI9_TETSI|nr:hypothetical protein HHK36_008975 [Tetracentron sinense]